MTRGPEYLVHPVTFPARPGAFHPEEEAGPEHPVVPAFLVVAELELPAARPPDSLAHPQRVARSAEAEVAVRVFAVVEQKQSARSC